MGAIPLFTMTKAVRITVVFPIAAALAGCLQVDGSWRLQAPAPVVSVADGGGNLFALVAGESERSLIKVDSAGKITWRVEVSEERLLGATESGSVVLLADPQKGQFSARVRPVTRSVP